jgi:hypothetical protein
VEDGGPAHVVRLDAEQEALAMDEATGDVDVFHDVRIELEDSDGRHQVDQECRQSDQV